MPLSDDLAAVGWTLIHDAGYSARACRSFTRTDKPAVLIEANLGNGTEVADAQARQAEMLARGWSAV